MINALTELMGKSTRGVKAEVLRMNDDDYLPILLFGADAAGIAFTYVDAPDFVHHKPWHTIQGVRVAATAYTTPQ